jgi:hypothetical protein
MRRSIPGEFGLEGISVEKQRRRLGGRSLTGTCLIAILAVGAGSIPRLLRAQAPEGPLPIGQGGPPPADTGDQNSPVNDPPTRAARLGLVEGNVSFQPGGVEDWVPATLNRPIATGDRLWTDAGARTELHLGSSAFRLNGRTNFTFVNLTDTLAQVQVSSGTLDVRVRRLAEQESVEIDTPQAAFTLLRAGEYRIDVTEQGDATIATVRGGDAEVAAGGQTFPLHPRDQVRVMEENGQPVFDRRTAPVADGFDNWCDDRDRREDRSPSARYVSRDMPGYADLDDHGVWTEEPNIGMVWAPQVPAGWAPYHNGHWAWIEPWGWTWVDDAPWGYAPFHYGRWAFIGPRWVWVPGPVVVGVRPVYAPALVAWVGGGGFGVSVGIGVGPAVGWFPLGPREVWVPPYRYSPAYITQVNVTNTVIVNRTVINNVNVTNVNYVNRGVPGAMTAVPQGAMVGGRPIAAAAVVVPPGAAAQARVGAYAAVAPQRGALVGGQNASTFAPPAAVANRAVVARTAPPPPPVSFNQRQAALQQNPGQPLNRTQVSQIQQTQPPSRPAFRPALQQSGAAQGTSATQGAPGGFGGNRQFGQQPGSPQPGIQSPAQTNRGQVGGGGQPAGSVQTGGSPQSSGAFQPGGSIQQRQQPVQNAAPRPSVQSPPVQNETRPQGGPPPARKPPPNKKGSEKEKRRD